MSRSGHTTEMGVLAQTGGAAPLSRRSMWGWNTRVGGSSRLAWGLGRVFRNTVLCAARGVGNATTIWTLLRTLTLAASREVRLPAVLCFPTTLRLILHTRVPCFSSRLNCSCALRSERM